MKVRKAVFKLCHQVSGLNSLLSGSFMDFAAVKRAMTGVYGVWVNLDSYVVGEMRETYAGIRIFETAKLVGTVKHYIWSNLDNVGKVGSTSSNSFNITLITFVENWI